MSGPLNSIAFTDTQRLLHPYTNARKHEIQGPIIIARGEGIRVFDQEGRSYIEGMAGLWSVALGFSEPRLAEAAYRQMQILPYYHSFSHKTHSPSVRLADRLVAMSPSNMSRVFFTSSGSEANDTVVKMIWYMNNALGRPKKKKFLARTKGYHGITVASGSLTGLPNNHRDFDLPAIPVLHLTCPHYYRFGQEGESELAFTARLIAEAEEVIVREGPDTIAAFIGEPLMAAGGVIPPPAGYWQGIEALCRKYDIVLIADEVINGFGRLGAAFGCMHYGFTPDVIVVSKQLTSSYMPLAAIIFSEAIYDPIADNTKNIGTFGHGFTASGHPVACAVALENLDIIDERGLIGNAAARAPAFQNGLRRCLDLPYVGEVRGEGLIAAIEMVADKETRARFDTPGSIGAAAFEIAHEEGLILRSIEDSLALCPPLIVTDEDVSEIVRRIGRVVERVGEFIGTNGLGRSKEAATA